MKQENIDYERIKKAIEFISDRYEDQPELNDVAEHVHLSPYHFQRLFIRWAGVSPKKFLQYITIENSKERLLNCTNLAEVAYDVGLSGTSRLHDLFVNIEGMTPNQYKQKGIGIMIYYDFYKSPFGRFLIAITNTNKICSIQFIGDENTAVDELKTEWFNSTVEKNREKTKSIAQKIFNNSGKDSLEILAKGTAFQIKVWESLLKIPFGNITSYQSVASTIDKPKALQAVGSAIGKNPVAFLIPCHRVIRKAGNISQYRWGETRKKAIIGWEVSSLESV